MTEVGVGIEETKGTETGTETGTGIRTGIGAGRGVLRRGVLRLANDRMGTVGVSLVVVVVTR